MGNVHVKLVIMIMVKIYNVFNVTLHANIVAKDHFIINVNFVIFQNLEF